MGKNWKMGFYNIYTILLSSMTEKIDRLDPCEMLDFQEVNTNASAFSRNMENKYMKDCLIAMQNKVRRYGYLYSLSMKWN